MAVVKLIPKAKKVERPKKATPSKPGRSLSVITTRALQNAKRMLNARSNPIHPYVLANHPPAVFPKGSSTVAMDDSINNSLSWASSQWQNSVFTLFDEGLVFPGYAYLAAITQRPEYRRPSEIIATAMTRKWIKLQSTTTDDDKIDKDDVAEKIKAINDELDRLQAKVVFKKMIELDGFFGRSHLYLDCCDPKDTEELKSSIGNGRNAASKNKINKAHPLLRLKAIEPVWCYPTQYNSNDPLTTNWYKPDMWFCMGKQIHASRLIPMVTREVPDMLKPAYSFGGIALSQLMKPYVDNWIRTRQSVSDLIHNFSITALKSDLTSLMQGDELLKRMQLFNLTKDNQGAMLIDMTTEDLVNVSTPLGSLDHLQAQAQEQMAAPCGIPLVVLFGITPTGLNATSEGEIEVFDDWIGAQQEAYMRAPLTNVIDFIQLSLYGTIDQNITFAFEPLRSMTEKELAETRKIESETDIAYINASVLSPLESRKRIAADPDSPYEALDVDELPIPPETEEGFGEGEEDDKDGGGEEGGESKDNFQAKDAVIDNTMADAVNQLTKAVIALDKREAPMPPAPQPLIVNVTVPKEAKKKITTRRNDAGHLEAEVTEVD